MREDLAWDLGREDYEALQYCQEEAAVHARMCRRTQFSHRTVRNIIVLYVVAELFKCTIFFYIVGSDIIIFLISAFHLSYNMLLNQLHSEDGKVDSTQILHNLNEDELPGFEESWKGNAGQHLPGSNQNGGISNGDNSALLYSTLKLNEKKWLHGV
ncbi:hypothetical protein ZWY2020_040836 [Hordeum vulgare]|nr:hypothetical protein ZWY2020_040836 [Hordeum vulgare]